MTKQRKKIVCIMMLILVLIALICFGVNSILKKETSSTEQSNGESNMQFEQQGVLEEQKEQEVEIIEEPCIKTPYTNLYYPEYFEELIATNEVIEDEKYIITFYAVLSNEQYPLFSVHFGDENGDVIGKIKCSDDITRNVSLIVFEIAENNSLDDNDMDTLYAMQESLNYTLNKLMEEESFIAQ